MSKILRNCISLGNTLPVFEKNPASQNVSSSSCPGFSDGLLPMVGHGFNAAVFFGKIWSNI